MKDLFKRLSGEFSAKQMKNYIKVNVPVIMWVTGGVIELRINKKDNGFIVYCPTNFFSEANAGGSQEFYFNIFERFDKNYHFDITLKNGKFYKSYKEDSNVVVAINEFIRFFIMLDDFIINNNVIGREEEYK